MKPVIYAISSFLMLTVASTTVLAYEESNCEVRECGSKSSKANSPPPRGQAKPKTTTEVKADAKTEAKTQAKAKLMEKAPTPLQEAVSFFK